MRPIIDIMENDLLGPAVLRGEAKVLSTQIRERFGVIPDWAVRRMEAAGEPELLDWSKRVLSATRIEDVIPPPPLPTQ